MQNKNFKPKKDEQKTFVKSKKLLWNLSDSNSDDELNHDELGFFLNPKNSKSTRRFFRTQTIESIDVDEDRKLSLEECLANIGIFTENKFKCGLK